MIPRVKHVPTDAELNDLVQGGAIARMTVNVWGVFCYLCTQQHFNVRFTVMDGAKALGMGDEEFQRCCNRLVELGYAELV